MSDLNLGGNIPQWAVNKCMEIAPADLMVRLDRQGKKFMNEWDITTVDKHRGKSAEGKANDAKLRKLCEGLNHLPGDLGLKED